MSTVGGSSAFHRAQSLVARLGRPGGTLAVVGLVFMLYYAAIYPWFMNWGASPAEQHLSLPGDTLPADPELQFTRAITIDAPASTVWAWVIQIGQDRAGFYSNTWLENIGGPDIHNADVIHPEWQQRALGERVPMAREEFHPLVGDTMYLTITVLEPGRVVGPLPGRFVLQPLDEQTTRLLLREERPTGALARATSSLLYDPMHFVMEQRMLRGIKERAEGQPLVPTPLAAAARVGWVGAAVAIVGLFVARRGTGPWLVWPLVTAAPALVLGHDPDAALAAFLISGAIVLGGRAFGSRWWPAFAVLTSLSLLITMVAALGVTVFGALALGKRWTVYILVAAGVLLVMLFTPDPYTTFGLGLDLLALVSGAVVLGKRERHTSARAADSRSHIRAA